MYLNNEIVVCLGQDQDLCPIVHKEHRAAFHIKPYESEHECHVMLKEEWFFRRLPATHRNIRLNHLMNQ